MYPIKVAKASDGPEVLDAQAPAEKTADKNGELQIEVTWATV